MLGYLDDEALRRDFSQGKVRFLRKRFNTGAVAREVHAALSHRR
jgi:hypothetical protein